MHSLVLRFAVFSMLSLALTCAVASSASAAQRIYVADFGDGDVAAAPVAAGGTIGTPLTPAATTGGFNQGVALTADGERLFTGDLNTSKLAAFGVAPATGALSGPVSTSSGGGDGIVVTPDGGFVYQATPPSIRGFSLATDGSVVAPVPGSPLTPSDIAYGLAVTPDGKYLYSANAIDSTVGAFSIGPDGKLTELPGSPYPSAASPFALSITPDGKHLYVPARTGSPQEVFGYDIASSGALAATPGSPFSMPAGVSNSFGSTITADGKYFFTANFSSGSVSGFSIGSSGALTQIPGSPLTIGGSPAGITSDADGSHLFVSNDNRPSVDVLAIEPGGSLTSIPDSPFAVGAEGDFQSVALSPVQPPAAGLTYTRSGNAVSFTASNSNVDSVVAGYLYDFGDGTTMQTTSARPSHKYAEPGTYTATVTETDEVGCSTTYISAGQTAYCNGGPGATATVTFDIPATSKSKPKLDVSAKSPQKLGKPIKLKLSAQPGVRVTAKAPRVKLKGGSQKSVRYRHGSVNIGESGKGKMKIAISGKNAEIAKGARSGKVKVKLTAANNYGKTTKTVKLKLK